MLRAARRTSPLPPQVVQRIGWVPALAPLPEQVVHRSSVLSLTDFFTPVGDLGQREPDGHPDVLPAARILAPPAEERLEPRHSAEVAHEDVERFGQVHVVEAEPALAPGARLAVAVVGRALLRIPEDLVRLGDLLELRLRVGGRVPVRVVLHRELAVGLLDVGLGAVARHAEQRVEIAHSSSPSTMRLVCSTSPMILSYGIRVGPITPMTPLSSPA